MTFLALTTCRDHERIVITQDSGVTVHPGGVPDFGLAESYQASIESCYTDRGVPPVPLSFTAPKAVQIGDVIVGGVGSLLVHATWVAALIRSNVSTIDEAGILAALHGAEVGPDAAVGHVFFAGFSQALGRALAFRVSSPGYATVGLEVGHLLHPPPYPGDAEYPAVLDRWEPAVSGIDVVDFHRLAAGTVLRAWRGGRMRNPWCMGGELQSYVVSEAGIEYFAEAIASVPHAVGERGFLG